jgi:hypothetical protein
MGAIRLRLSSYLPFPIFLNLEQNGPLLSSADRGTGFAAEDT